MDDQQPEVKAEQAPAPVKKEAPIVAETKILDGAAPSAPSGKKKNSAKKQKTEPGNDDTVVSRAKLYLNFFKISGQTSAQTEVRTCHLVINMFFSNPVDEAHVQADSAASANHQAAHNDDVPSKGSGKKQKNETDKGKRKKACPIQSLVLFDIPYPLCSHIITC